MISRYLSLSVLTTSLLCATAQSASPLPANYIHVNAPMAQRLVLAVKAKHPEIKKLGLHATPPNAADNAIIGSDIASKIGKKSSEPDMEKVVAAKPSAERIDKEGIYDLFLPVRDAQGRDIGQGFVVMEVPFANASNAEEALHIGEAIRNEVQQQIPSRAALYQ